MYLMENIFMSFHVVLFVKKKKGTEWFVANILRTGWKMCTKDICKERKGQVIQYFP